MSDCKATLRWFGGAVNVYRPDGDGVSVWSVARVISTIDGLVVGDIEKHTCDDLALPAPGPSRNAVED